MNLTALEKILANQPAYRIKQIKQAVYSQLIEDWNSASNLPAELKRQLQENCPLQISVREVAGEASRKAVITLSDGAKIETVLIANADGRQTVCVSSQVGCPLGCLFCATGQGGFDRNLTTEEILEQVLYFARGLKEEGKRIDNVVFMGMGEPLLNYDAVLNAMRIMLDDFAYGMSKRRVTLSTSGVVPKIDQLAQDIDVALAISLHATNNQLRDELVPINKKYPLEQLIAACQRYIGKDGNESARKHVTIEYVMLDGVNDHPEHAQQMIKLLKNLPSKINLIPFNPFPHAPYGRSSRNRIISFQKTLSDAGFVCTIRQTRGDDIDAACGQLVGQVADRTRRAEQWKKKVAAQNEIIRSQG